MQTFEIHGMKTKKSKYIIKLLLDFFFRMNFWRMVSRSLVQVIQSLDVVYFQSRKLSKVTHQSITKNKKNNYGRRSNKTHYNFLTIHFEIIMVCIEKYNLWKIIFLSVQVFLTYWWLTVLRIWAFHFLSIFKNSWEYF